jgi:hypothetical protein
MTKIGESLMRSNSIACAAILLAVLTLGVAHAAPKKPNILFVIMDDVGMDQMSLFGYGGAEPPKMPNIEQIAHSGLQFSNSWAMPACSTSRAVFFSGRYPLRTNVLGALGPDDLANSQLSPFEMTLPLLLKQKGYQSGIFGKYHLGLQGKNPFKDFMPRSLGWDYFYGWLDVTGDPSSIDKTAGGVAQEGEEFSCGFVPGAAQGGADFGACYHPGNVCEELVIADGVPPGRTCRDSGGILDPGAACNLTAPSNIQDGFDELSAHYVSPLVINKEVNGESVAIAVPPQDIEARTFRGSIQVDAAIDWIQSLPKHQPWMASVSFSSTHTPVMQPPQHLISADPEDVSNLSCDTANIGEQRLLTNLMIEALDTEFARLLVSIGVAKRNKKGKLKYNPHNNNTMIVILGDNGTLGTVVKVPPFDPTRAKGTAYQTGVWVPLIISGPMVRKPDRDVPYMVNIADLYQLFGEMAGIDVHASVPRKLDSQAMMPYLKKPRQKSIRDYNFTQVGPNIQAGNTINGPCTINTGCTQIPVTEGVCTDNGGTWWGEGTDQVDQEEYPDGLEYCCDVNQYLYENERQDEMFNLQPLRSVAVRNDDYKVVRNFFRGPADPKSVAGEPNCDPNVTDELYRINETTPLLDYKALNLIDLFDPLPPKAAKNYVDLTEKLVEILTSEPNCIGDGNIDGVVNELDQEDWAKFAALSEGQSSWFDFNRDGLTNAEDLAIIQANQGPCGD